MGTKPKFVETKSNCGNKTRLYCGNKTRLRKQNPTLLWEQNPFVETKPDFIVGTKPVCRNKTRLYCGKKPVCGNKTRLYCGNNAQLRRRTPTCAKLLLFGINSERTSFSEAFVVWHERIYSRVTLHSQQYQLCCCDIAPVSASKL